MNKDLVKQLAEKAGFTAGAERYSTPDYQTVEPELLEKFAELIIRECVAVVGHFEYGPDGEQGEFAMDVLRQHFGVE